MKSLLCLFCFALLAVAQGQEAVLTGEVLDTTGAKMPGAVVTALNVNTGVSTTDVTNEAGVYLFAALPPGEYRVTAEKAGFKKYILNKQVLRIGDKVSLNLPLEVGVVTDSVQVEANSEAVNTLTASQGSTLNNRSLADLPLNTRNAMDLVNSQPGVVGTNFNGGGRDMLNIALDGVNIQDNFITEALSTVQISTNIDRIEEVKIVTSPADAEYGRGSGQVLLISRSGTNAFHGSLFDNIHNTSLNANSWSNNRAGNPRSVQVSNDTGARIDGPIRKNKTFFFGLFEGNINRYRSTTTTTTLTDTARQGIYRFYPGATDANANALAPTVDFSGNPVQPAKATGPLQSVSLFGLDPNRLKPDTTGVISKFMGLLPSPTVFTTGDGLNTAGFNWTRASSDDIYSMNIKIDHNFNEKERLTASYAHDTEKYPNGFDAQPLPQSPIGLYTDTGTVGSLTLTSTLRPNLLNEVHAGVSRNGVQFHAPWTVPGQTQSSILPTFNNIPYLPSLPLVTTPLATGSGEDPQGRLQPTYQYGEKISWLHGRHAIKAGAELRFVSTNSFVSFYAVPRITVRVAASVPTQNITTISGIGANSSNATSLIALLAGSVASENQYFYSPGGANPQWLQGEVAQHTWRNKEVGTFLQDDIKLKPNFTLNVGVRWDLYGVPYEADGRLGTVVGGSQNLFGISGTSLSNLFQPGVMPGSLTQLQLIGRNSPHPGIQPWGSSYKNFAPFLGLSWGLPWFGKDKTVFRAGYSIAYEHLMQVLFDQLYGYSAPGVTQPFTYAPPSYQNLVNATLPMTPVGLPLATVPINDNNASPITILGADSGLKTPYIQNWNASLGREIHRGLTLDVRYVGTKGTKMVRGININENNIFENGILNAFNITEAGGNSALLNQIFNGLNITSAGVVNGTTVTGSSAMRLNSTLNAFLTANNVGGFANFLQYNTFITGVRGGLLLNGKLPANFAVANPQFGSDYLIGNFSNSTYNSLQIQVNQRFAHGFQIQGSYVRSKALGDYNGNSQSETANFRTIRDEHLDKTLLSFDEPNVWRMTGIYDLPFGPQKQFFGSSHSVLGKILEKWEVSSVFYKLSGTPTTFSNSATGTYNNLGGATTVANGPLPTGSVHIVGNNVVYFNGLTQVPDPSIQNMPSSVQSLSTLLAVAGPDGKVLLQQPTPGSLGGLSTTAWRGLGSFTFNATASKSITLNQEHNVTLRFRADAINLLNHEIWGTPNLSISSTSFGLITSASGSRSVNLTLRLEF